MLEFKKDVHMISLQYETGEFRFMNIYRSEEAVVHFSSKYKKLYMSLPKNYIK
jgi:hypothetical protein